MGRLGGYLLLATGLSIGVNQATWAQVFSFSPTHSYGNQDPRTSPSADALGQRGWLITPSIGLDFTKTDNVNLKSSGGDSDLITRLSPGIRVQGESARARAYIDFKLTQVNYLESHGQDNLQRALTGVANIKLVDNLLFLDVSGRIARQAISAFGTPASGSDSINANVVESSMYQVAPYIQGQLFGSADYRLRYENTFYDTKSTSSPLNNTTVQALQGNISGTTTLTRLSWNINAYAQENTYSNDRTNETGAARATLTYAIDPQLRVLGIVGKESQDYLTTTKQTSSIKGLGFEWAPTERTQVAWTQEDRYFGQGRNFKFTHRTASTAWRVIDTRDVSILPPQAMTFSRGTYYDIYNELLRAQFPDDAARQTETLARLQALGISPQSQVIGGFMSSQASINRNREASVIWSGVRNVVTLSAQSLDRAAMGPGNGLPDDFSNFNTPVIKQKGATINWAHKFTPTATGTLVANKSQTSGNTSSLSTDYLTYSAILTNKLGAYTTGSLGLRRTEVTGGASYVENAVIGSLLMVF